MKLADWLFENSITPGQLRRMLGGVNRATVHRYLMDLRVPRPDLLDKIESITKGDVRLRDFLDPKAPDCARIVKTPSGDERFVLPWSKAWAHADEPPHQSSRLTAPVQRAIYALEGRAWFTPSGTFLLDGRVSDPKRIVARANEVLAEQRKPLIAYPGVHLAESPQRADSAPQLEKKRNSCDD